MFCYSTERVSVNTNKPDFGFDPLKCNATKVYLEHYQNFLTLHIFADHGTIHEKAQAMKELDICRRKLTYWQRQPHFNRDLAEQEKAKLNRKGR